MRKLTSLLLAVLLASCNLPAPAAPTAVPAAPPASPAPLTPTSTLPPSPAPHTSVNASTLTHKLMMGYQGWFTCANDGAGLGYLHWFHDGIPDAAHLRVDMWPDTSELSPEELCPTSLKYPNGQPAYLYSAINPATVLRHFQWMSQYGVDGVFVQRFGAELVHPTHFKARNIVNQNAQAGAEAYGRVYAIMYDTSGMESSTFVEILENDWKYMVDVLKVTESPSYLHHNGKPVLAIWGLGFTQHPGSPQQAQELIQFFEHNPEEKYRVTLLGGVPTWWRILQNDALPDPAWADYYCSLDIISPWTVGRYRTDLEVDLYQLTMQQDMARAAECGAEYMPVIFPGTAFHNDNKTNRFNDTPRRGGNFYWRQVYDALSIGAPMLYNAMFDEVDEDTAMYKIAATANDQPLDVDLVSMDTDGYQLPNDWYLRLAGAASQMLRGEIALTAEIPINSGYPPPPTPTGQRNLRLQISTSSDWAALSLKSGATPLDARLVSVSPAATNLSANGGRFGVGQAIPQANSGNKVELVLDLVISGAQPGGQLEFSLESGAIGSTTLNFYRLVNKMPILVQTVLMEEMAKTFSLPVDLFVVP